METKTRERIIKYGLLGVAIAGLTLLSCGCGLKTGGEPFRMPEEPDRPQNRNPNNPNRDPLGQGRRLQTLTADVGYKGELPYPTGENIAYVELFRRQF